MNKIAEQKEKTREILKNQKFNNLFDIRFKTLESSIVKIVEEKEEEKLNKLKKKEHNDLIDIRLKKLESSIVKMWYIIYCFVCFSSYLYVIKS